MCIRDSYGIAGGSDGWIPGADVPFIGADGFCSPIGSGWERRVTSEFGNRVDPITGKRKGHTGMDLAVPTEMCIRDRIYSTMKTTINRLRDFPLMGQTHPDPILAASGYRKLVLTKTYVAIYKLIGDTVYVYAIVNGTTDYPRLLK